MSLKKKVESFLEARGNTINDLANYLNIDLTLLEKAMDDSSLEVRILEEISKVLRIPLYSFFPYLTTHTKRSTTRHYTESLPGDDTTGLSEKEELKQEIQFLTDHLEARKKRLAELI